ncbi:hypothetical protein V6O07_07565, partial [Arthrospira platensis SPKY2]
MKVSCRGGLDLRSTSQELLNKPGYAEVLQNFECCPTGGYRRINGYRPWGVNTIPQEPEVDSEDQQIKGIYIFGTDSILVAKGSNLYHTFDGLTWVQVNKDITGVSYTDAKDSEDIIPMDSEAPKVRFAHYTNGTMSDEHYV